jgi:peptide chain release factor 2
LKKKKHSGRGCGKASRKCEVIFDIPARQNKLTHLEIQTGDTDFWTDQNRAKATLDQINAEKAILAPFVELENLVSDCQVLIELAQAEKDPAVVAQVQEDIQRDLARSDALFRQLEIHTLLDGRFDHNNAFLTLHAGAGGTESCDWAEMLFRMYRRYCEAQGFAIDILDIQPGDEAGIKSAQFAVMGTYAYGYLQAERGVHRLVRISPFDANKRRHTSFASLDVAAELTDDIVVEINENDLRVDTYRSSGAGGQHVNKTDSAIRITHLPSGIVVSCQAERSQHNNRNRAMKMLAARLYEMQLDQKRKDLEKFYGLKGEIAWGNQIRSYVLQPYTMAKDHRTSIETSDVQSVLDGELNDFVYAYLKARKKMAAEASGAGIRSMETREKSFSSERG